MKCRRHLVVGERGAARHAGLDGGEARAQLGDGAADGLDRLLVAEEAALVPLGRLDQDEEQALVLGEEIAGVRLLVPEREEGAPRGSIRRGLIEARPDLLEEHAQEARVDGQVLVVEPEVEEVGDEGGGQLRVDAFEQAGQARIPREALHELLVVEDLVADLLELVRRQVQELVALELLGVDPVGDALELDGRGAQLLHEAGGIGLGALEGARLHHHDDVLELAEVLGVLDVALHVRRALGEHVAPGRLERERVQRVGDARDGEEHGQQRPSGPGVHTTPEPAGAASDRFAK